MSHCLPGGLAVEPLQQTLQQNRALHRSTTQALRPAADVELYSSTACSCLFRVFVLRVGVHRPFAWAARSAVFAASVARRMEGGSAAMGKDGVAAPQARSVARAPRPPSWVQRACLTELLGSRFAQCAAAGRRGYCRPAASSSAARGSRLQHGTRPMRAHACSALSAASLRRWRCPVAATVAALPEFFAGTLGDPSVRGPV